MKLRFYGTRGSISSSSADWRKFYTHEFGGNTTSAVVELPDSKKLYFLDAGNGIMPAGDSLLEKVNDFKEGKGELSIYLTHVHWDHIQGFPFFRPAYRKGNVITVYGNPNHIDTLNDAISGSNPVLITEYAFQKQMSDFVFPIRLNQLPNKIQFKEVEDMQLTDRYKLCHQKLFHPQGVYSYKFIDMETNKALVFATDTELDCMTQEFGEKERKTMEWVGDCDIVIHEGQYTEGEYIGKDPIKYEDVAVCRSGWGHSVPKKVVDILLATLEQKAPKTLYITHHDPKHDDAFLRQMEAETKKYAIERLHDLKRHESDLSVRFAREGDVVELDSNINITKYHFLGA